MSVDQREIARGRERREAPAQHAHVEGWGADLDPAQRPAVPKERTPPRLENVPWSRPEPQVARVEVLRSTERQGMTAVFGTTVPPSGLSGQIRRVAFRFSENDLRHWMLLLVADRVNMVEGIGQDLRSGHVPNLFAEAGGRAALRHDRAATMRKLAVAGVAVAGAGLYLWSRARRRY
jgi:hypothetical protein